MRNSSVPQHPFAEEDIKNDMDALVAVVSVIPCGRSARLELGYATGGGKLTKSRRSKT